MEHSKFGNSPDFIDDNAAVGKGYLEAAKVSVSLAAWIREIGWPAKAHFFISEEVVHLPIAVEAGVGELARNGSLITREFGPRVRLATVTTDLPLAVDGPIDIGVQAMCTDCNKDRPSRGHSVVSSSSCRPRRPRPWSTCRGRRPGRPRRSDLRRGAPRQRP